MVQQSRILIGPFHFEIADNEAWEQWHVVGCRITYAQLFFTSTDLSCLPWPCSTPYSKASSTGHRSQPDSPTGALTGLHLKMTVPFLVNTYSNIHVVWPEFSKHVICINLQKPMHVHSKRYIPVESPSLHTQLMIKIMWIVHEWLTSSKWAKHNICLHNIKLTWLWLDQCHFSIVAALQMNALLYYKRPLAIGLHSKWSWSFMY